jgi:hypothetical protein
VISTRVRHVSLFLLWTCIGISAFVFIGRAWLVALLLLVATAVTIHLVSLPTSARPSAAD